MEIRDDDIVKDYPKEISIDNYIFVK